jgi:hypothetical protein
MKNYILLFFGFACVGMHAADVAVVASIPYYVMTNAQEGKILGYVSVEVTPTLSAADIQNTMLAAGIGQGALWFHTGWYQNEVNVDDDRYTQSIAQKNDLKDKSKKGIKEFIETKYFFVLSPQ